MRQLIKQVGKIFIRPISWKLILPIIIILLIIFFNYNIKVTIENNSGACLRNIRLFYRGGESQLVELQPNESWKVSFNPKAESNLIIEFVDDNGRERSANIGIYLEQGYKGHIKIIIDARGYLSVDTSIFIF
jgi:hypothetical protein